MASSATSSLVAMNEPYEEANSAEMSHLGHIEGLITAMDSVRENASRVVASLSEDAAQPHLVAAAMTAESALRVERARLEERAFPNEGDDQQQLAV